MLFRPSGKGRKRQKKGEKGRFRPISGKGGQTPLKPPFVTPPFAAAQTCWAGSSDIFYFCPSSKGRGGGGVQRGGGLSLKSEEKGGKRGGGRGRCGKRVGGIFGGGRGP